MIDYMSRSSIIGLFLCCSPTAILCGIRPVIVDAIDRMGWRGLAPHVSKEVGVIFPSRIYCDAATAIVLIVGLVGIIAAFAQPSPRSIFWRRVRFAVLSRSPHLIFSKTAAGACVAVSKVRTRDCFFPTAITLTVPSDISTAVATSETYNCKPAKSLTEKVYNGVWHGLLIQSNFCKWQSDCQVTMA